MRKYFSVLIALILVASLLSGCGEPSPAPDPSGTEENNENTEPVPDPAEDSPGPVFTPAEYDPRYDDDPNFIFYFMSNMGATEDTFFFAYSDSKIGQRYHETICFLDKASGYVGPLCGKPECTHDNQDCNAYIGGWSRGLSVYDGRLYWLEEVMTGGISYSIYSTALDGTDRRLVRALDRDLIQNGAVNGVFHRGWFYMAGEYQKVENGEPNSYVYMVAWPLDPEEEAVVLLDMPMNKASTNYSIQGYGDGVFLFVQKPVEEELIIARWNPETQVLETFYEGAFPNYGGRYHMVREDGVYFVDIIRPGGPDDFRCVLYRYDFASGEFEENTDFETPYTKYGISHSWLISDDLLVMADLTEDGGLTVMAVDFEGHILLDQTYPFEVDFEGSSYYCGRDETNLYLYYPRDPEMLIAVALDGSGAKILWDSDVGVH